MQYEEVARLCAGHRHISRHRTMPPYSTAFGTRYLPKGNIRCGQVRPSSDILRIEGFDFLLPHASEMRKGIKQDCDSELTDIFCRSREKPYKGGFHAQWHTELKVRGSVEAIRRLADTKLLHSYW